MTRQPTDHQTTGAEPVAAATSGASEHKDPWTPELESCLACNEDPSPVKAGWTEEAWALLVRIADDAGAPDDWTGEAIDYSEEAAALVYETPTIKTLRVGDTVQIVKQSKAAECAILALYTVETIEPERIEFVFVEGQSDGCTIGGKPSHSYTEKRLWLSRQKAGECVTPMRRLRCSPAASSPALAEALEELLEAVNWRAEPGGLDRLTAAEEVAAAALSPETVARAHLISAAPDLYAALERAAGYVEMYLHRIDGEVCGGTSIDLKAIDAALAKARGQ